MSNIPKLYTAKSQFEQFGSKLWFPMSSFEIVQCLESQLESFTATTLVNFGNTNHYNGICIRSLSKNGFPDFFSLLSEGLS